MRLPALPTALLEKGEYTDQERMDARDQWRAGVLEVVRGHPIWYLRWPVRIDPAISGRALREMRGALRWLDIEETTEMTMTLTLG